MVAYLGLQKEVGQSPFSLFHGTNLALIEVIDSIYRGLDSGKIVCGVFLDFLLILFNITYCYISCLIMVLEA